MWLRSRVAILGLDPHTRTHELGLPLATDGCSNMLAAICDEQGRFSVVSCAVDMPPGVLHVEAALATVAWRFRLVSSHCVFVAGGWMQRSCKCSSWGNAMSHWLLVNAGHVGSLIQGAVDVLDTTQVDFCACCVCPGQSRRQPKRT